MHIPVCRREALRVSRDTAGGHVSGRDVRDGRPYGGHRRRLSTGIVIANDQDAESLELARQNTVDCAGRIRFQHGPFFRAGSGARRGGVGAGGWAARGFSVSAGIS